MKFEFFQYASHNSKLRVIREIYGAEIADSPGDMRREVLRETAMRWNKSWKNKWKLALKIRAQLRAHKNIEGRKSSAGYRKGKNRPTAEDFQFYNQDAERSAKF